MFCLKAGFTRINFVIIVTFCNSECDADLPSAWLQDVRMSKRGEVQLVHCSVGIFGCKLFASTSIT